MQKKKSPQADLQSKRVLFFEAGLVIALGAVIWVFSWGIQERNIADVAPPPPVTDTDMVYVPRTEEKTKPQAGSTRLITEIEIWNLVDNLKKPTVDIGVMPDIDGIFDAPDVKPITFEKPKFDDNDIFVVVESMPKFMGGDQETFRRWVLSNIVYPEAALMHGIYGKVRVEFIVEKDGTISGITILESPDRTLSDATIKVMQKAPAWEPGMQRNKPARVKFSMPVDFRINER